MPLYDKLADRLKKLNSEDLLKALDTPEKASTNALSGEVRQKYLKALDEVYGNKEKRMKDMGFGGKTYYHGSPSSDIKEFDKAKLGTTTGGPGTDKNFFFTDNPEVANDYVQKESLAYEPKEIKDSMSEYKARGVPFEEYRLLAEPGTVYPVKLNEENMGITSKFDRDAVSSQMDELGLDRTQINNVSDGFSRNTPKSEINMVNNPASIRSVNAAFDPRFKDSANILAMNGSQPKIPGLMDTLKQAGSDMSRIASNLYKDSALEKADNYRSQALDRIINATDITRNVPEADTSTAKQYGRMGLDLIVPDVTDAIPMGKLGKLGALGIKEGKALKRGEKTVEEMMQGIRKADSSDLRAGSNLIGKPVFATAEEKALGFGKVTTPDIGTNVGHNEIMKVLNESPTYKNLINDRELFKTNPSAYDAQKQALINKAREYLIQKAGK